MKIIADCHTHSKYSKFHHGKNTIEEMVISARDKGLKTIAITDHGPRHIFFGTSLKNMQKARLEIDELKNKYPDINILLGIEANLITRLGTIDVSEQMEKLLDVCLLGFHKGAYGSFSNLLNLPVVLGSKNNPKKIQQNTDVYIKAIECNHIDVLTHLNEYIRIDPFKIAEACEKNNVYIEINNRHLKLTEMDIKEMLKTNVKFIISSDSHSASNIAKMDIAIQFAEKYIPKDRIVNYEKNPVFKNHKG